MESGESGACHDPNNLVSEIVSQGYFCMHYPEEDPLRVFL
jgi:hypothetical protein